MPVRRAPTAARVVPRVTAKGPEDIPYDDEPLTPQELAAIGEGERAAARGDVVPLEEVLRELGYRSRPARKKGAGARAGTRPGSARKSPARHAR